jgi:hypothetical protein
MSKFGINVPDGIAATTLGDVISAAEAMKDEKGEVRLACSRRSGFIRKALQSAGHLTFFAGWGWQLLQEAQIVYSKYVERKHELNVEGLFLVSQGHL